MGSKDRNMRSFHFDSVNEQGVTYSLTQRNDSPGISLVRVFENADSRTENRSVIFTKVALIKSMKLSGMSLSDAMTVAAIMFPNFGTYEENNFIGYEDDDDC